MTAINLKVNKLLELFKNLKSDAVPRAPRAADATEAPTNNTEEYNGNNNTPEDYDEEIVIEPEPEPEDDIKKQKKSKNKFFKSKQKVYDEDKYKGKKEKGDSDSSVNVQATGNVYNIVNSKGVRLGNDYYFGPVTQTPQSKVGKEKKCEEDEEIEKDNFIKLLMEATIRPDHDYIDYVSKNLGKNWHCFFRTLGFTQGRIETAEINAAGYDISEARYKLLLHWVNNEDDATLGRLATLLWEEGERVIVRHLSIMYKKSRK